MTPDRALELFPFFEAYANGETVQYLDCVDGWIDDDDFDPSEFTSLEYRIKPKPREFYVCSSYPNQNTKVAYENVDEHIVDHYHEYILVREVL